MARKLLFPNAIDYVRQINDNIVDNRLGGRSSYILLPQLYNRAYIVSHETGEIKFLDNVVAPDESISLTNEVNIVTRSES